MNCPIDGSTLVMSERSGVEIDYCPQCRGVWLDRGELDKIIERSAGTGGDSSVESAEPHEKRDSDARGQQPRRKESWLGDLFG